MRVRELHGRRPRRSAVRSAASSGGGPCSRPCWVETDLVFTSKIGTPLDPAHVSRNFRIAIGTAEGVDLTEWRPRELRLSFVSPLSDSGVPLEETSRLVGHSSTAVPSLSTGSKVDLIVQLGTVARASKLGNN